ncbi:MAG: biotin--[acetyl-CoA-carboxylase] ligase [Cyanobacteria bacterium RYN_339]|nr:biotin--[acetyl-CoA-carboxylase] ligase [Cyanobacteria bacterium RYN_339]
MPPLIALDETDSTSLHLKRLVLEGCPLGTVVTARRQTAGYGQRGRSWDSAPDAGLYMSILLPLPASAPTQLPFVLGLGCRDGLLAWTDEVGLKWVNDLVARRRKLGGLLVEVVKGGAIAGIGVNLATPDLPEAIGLNELTPTPPTLEALRDALLAGIHARLAAPFSFDAWSAASVTLGQRVRVETLEGVAEALGPNGELQVRRDDGTLMDVISGSVRLADGAYC